MKFPCSRILSLGVLAALAGCATGPSRLKVGQASGGEVIEAEGWVSYVANDLPGIKAAALAAAQRSAVEKKEGAELRISENKSTPRWSSRARPTRPTMASPHRSWAG